MIFENLEIEQALLGRMLISDSAALVGLDLCETDFSIPEHWRLFSEILGGKRLINFAGTERYEYVRLLVDAVGMMPIIPGQDGYAEVLKELGRKRKIFAAVKEAETLLEHKDSAEILAMLNAKINETVTVNAVKSRAEVRQEILAGIDLPKTCYSTGFKNIDAVMGGGLYEGFTYAFCGAEKAGKTTLAHSISHNLPCKHLYVAMEMGSVQIEQRNLAHQMKINSLKFLDGPQALRNGVETAQCPDNVYYLDAPGETTEEILHKVGMAALKHGIKGFIVDYWQLVTGQQRGENEEKHLRHVAQSFANFARKHKLFCIILAQMNKDGQLFGGNGLRKACDQLYMIENCDQNTSVYGRWLRMDASRYTFKADLGGEHNPAIALNPKSGPCFEELC